MLSHKQHHDEGAVIALSKRHEDGSYTMMEGRPVNGLLGAIVELWRFWRHHGTGLDDYDRFELRIVRR